MKRSLPDGAYDELADAYADSIDTKPHNAYYERPALQSLIGDVGGKRILDAGCGPGVYTEWLLDKGAVVTALDSNEKMLGYAMRRNGERAAYRQANLEEPLDFLGDGSFDGIVSALTVTYIADHTKLFKEFNRILSPGGWLVFSTEHPFFSYQQSKTDGYFDTEEIRCVWRGFGKPVTMSSYYHSLGAICGSLADSGFAIERLLEPKPTSDYEAVDPAGYDRLMKFPLFIMFRAVKL